jgi:HEAT repeat protein
MRRLNVMAFLTLALAAACGCAHRQAPQQTIGLIPPAERIADLRDDRVRLLGVDRAPVVPPQEPLYQVPFIAVGAGFDAVFVEPFWQLYRHFTGDNAERAARYMLDTENPDHRREGTLRLAAESYARQGEHERDLWADLAGHDTDYTVRAAGIRALNWSRDNRKGQLYIAALNDDQPLVRLEAAKALANNPNPDAATPLLAHLAGDVSEDVRIASADALRCYKTEEVAHALIGMLADSNFDVAWQSRQSLRLMTAHDFHYDQRAWLGYLSENRSPFK